MSEQMLKATALLYIKEALMGQQYEACAELVSLAKGFGAAQAEIRDAINAALGNVKPPGRGEAVQGKNRLRSLI